MSDNKIAVPDGMMNAAKHAFMQNKGVGVDGVEDCIEAALRWLSENPIVPNDEQLFSISRSLDLDMAQIVWSRRDRALIAEWQRRMFLAPQPQIMDTAFGKFVIDTRVPPGEIRLENWNGPTLVQNIGTGEAEKNHG